MDLDDVSKTHHPEDFVQMVKLLEFLSDPIIYPPKGKMQDNISFEVFVNICDHLPPQDLLMLSCVCKNFANMLDADIFAISSEIWKSSREHFTVFKDMDPPKGMSQKRFAQLLNFGKEYEFQIDKSIIDGIPPLVPCPDDGGKTQYYWLPHVTSVQRKLQTESNSNEPKPEVGHLNEENIERHLLVTQYWKEQVVHQQNKVQTIVREFYEKKILNTSDIFTNNPVIKNIMGKILINPFVEQDFKSFIEELKTVYGHSTMDAKSSKDFKPNRPQRKNSMKTYPSDYEPIKKEKEASVPFSKYPFDHGTPTIKPMPPIIPNGQFMDTSGSQMKPINPIPGPQMNSIRKPMQSSQINSANAPPVANFPMDPINTPITNLQMANLQMNQINHMPLVP
ncbi:14705_t:CDS:2, partial [Racocetra fulgida]